MRGYWWADHSAPLHWLLCCPAGCCSKMGKPQCDCVAVLGSGKQWSRMSLWKALKLKMTTCTRFHWKPPWSTQEQNWNQANQKKSGKEIFNTISCFITALTSICISSGKLWTEASVIVYTAAFIHCKKKAIRGHVMLQRWAMKGAAWVFTQYYLPFNNRNTLRSANSAPVWFVAFILICSVLVRDNWSTPKGKWDNLTRRLIFTCFL